MNDQSKTKQALIQELVTLRKKIAELEQLESDLKLTEGEHQHHIEGPGKNSSASSEIRVSGINVAWNAEQGTCTFEDLPVAMMWVDTTLAGLMSGVQAMVGTERFFLALQSEGRKSVEADWQIVSNYPDFREGFRAIANIAAVAGWGYWELFSLNTEQRECCFRIRDSWEGRYQKSLGVCWGSGMLAGKMAGYCSKLFKINCWADQTQFIAKGDNYEEFVVKPSPRLIETEIDNLLKSDEATRADMAVALRELEKEITERKQAMKELQESEKRFATIFNTLQNGIIIIDPETHTIIDANSAALHMIGTTHEGIIGHECNKFVCPAEKGRCPITDLGIDIDNSERVLIKKDGTERSILKTVGWLTLGDKNFLIESFIDNTDRKLAEEALQESEERFKTLFEKSMDAQILIDHEGKVIDCNDAFVKLFSLQGKSDVLGHRPSEFSPEFQMNGTPSSEMGKKILTTVLEKGSSSFEWLHQKHDPARTPILNELSCTLIKIANRPMIHVTIRNITERKRAEDALRESEERYRQLFMHAPAAIYEIDYKNRRFVSFNDIVPKFTGYTREELMTMDPWDFFTEVSQKTYLARMKLLMEGKEMPLSAEYEIRKKDGGILWALLHVQYKLEDGIPVSAQIVAHDITDRKKSEEALRESEEKYRSLATTEDSMYLVDSDCRYLFMNEGHLSRFDLPLERMIGRPYSEFHSAESTRVFVEKVNQVFESGRPLQHEYRSEKDGRYLIRTFSPVRSPDGKATAAVTVVSKDVTERKKAEEERKASEERYQQLVQFAPTAIYEVDFLQNKFTSVNDAMIEYVGYSREELLSMSPLEVLTDESKRLFVERLSKYLSGEKIPETVTLKIRKKDGEEFWALLNVRFIDKDGRPSGAHVVAQDISDRVRAEEALRKSEEKYRAIIENMEEGYIEVDLAGRLIFFNKAAQQFLGYSKEETMGMHYKKYADQENAEKIFKLYSEVYRTHIPNASFQWEVIRQDGIRRSVEGSASLISDAEGRPVRFRSLFRDVTDRKRLQEEHEQLQERLHRAEKMEALGTLAGGVAHDLNNVLGVLVGYSELLLQNLPQDTPLRRHAMQILQGGWRAAAIIQDLLTLTRRGVLVSDVVNLNSVISEFLQTPEFEAAKIHHPGVKFKTSLDAELLNVKGSPTHLGKTVMNLLSNAAEAITGLGEVLITTENRYVEKPIHGYDSTREGEYAVLTVSDTGSGISSSDIGRIFEPFYTKKAMGRSGTGLGLAVVWGTVKDHSGYIDVQSAEGKGTIFTLYFPVTREAITMLEQAVPQSIYMGRGEHILVVDDVEGQRLLASSMLESLGYKVDSVARGEEAVEFVQNKPVDLLILDMIMDPGIDGLETYRRILEIRKDQKAIIVSGFAMTERLRQTQELGAGAYVKKPYLREKIGLAIRKELDRI